jgi:RimJ/RimL family protein N-acetyltransferase
MSNPIATSKGVVAIRPAVPGDAAPLRALRLEALAGHPQAFAADVALTAAEPVEAWAERIAQYASESMGVICLAEAEGQLIGMAGLVRGHWPKTRHGGTLWGVYVRADWRGFHLAEALVEACTAWAQAQGVAIVKLGVVTTNTPAIRCYARCGFAAYGLDPKVLYLDRVFYDELLMARPV